MCDIGRFPNKAKCFYTLIDSDVSSAYSQYVTCPRPEPIQKMQGFKTNIFTLIRSSDNACSTIYVFFKEVSLMHLFQIKPTRWTIFLSIFSSTSLHVSGNYVPIIRRTYCIYATLVFFTLYGWLSGLLVGMSTMGGCLVSLLGWVLWVAVWSACWDESHPNQQTKQPPIQSEKYQCRVDTIISPDDGHIVARNMHRSWNKDTKK